MLLAATMAISAGSVYSVMAEETTATETTTEAAAEETAADAEVLTLNWDEVKDQVAAAIEGADVEIGASGMKAFVPSEMQPMELTDEYLNVGYVAIYQTADEQAQIRFSYNETQYNTPESYMEFLEGAGAVNIGLARINGLDAVHYEDDVRDIGYVTVFVDDSHVFEVGATPFSDPGVSAVAGIVFTSLQNA